MQGAHDGLERSSVVGRAPSLYIWAQQTSYPDSPMTQTATLSSALTFSGLFSRLRAAFAQGPVPCWTEYLRETAGKA
jgi:hypothetical protein